MAHDFKSLLIGLLPSDEDAGAVTPAVACGIALARRFGARATVHAFVPRVVAPYSAVGGFASGLVASENARRRELASAAGAAAAEAATAAGIAHVLDVPDLPFDELSDRFDQLSRLQDLVVLDAGDDKLAGGGHVIEEALFNSGRPVLVVPKTGGNVEPRRIAIAWDGSARSARAVGDALPLLKAAQAVSVIVVAGEKDLSRAASGRDLLAYLALHGVTGELAMIQAVGGDVAEALRRHLVAAKDEMLVMGAFVHSRFRQAVLGGVTRSLLQSSPVPLFLAH